VTAFSAGTNMRLIKDTNGGVLVEYALVLLVLSVAIWIVIIGLSVTIANHIESVASASGAAATTNLPSVPAPDYQ
jgi:Flp pilus assembly pilin Flp